MQEFWRLAIIYYILSYIRIKKNFFKLENNQISYSLLS